ncbi:hypothetical protein [Streptomyces sp. NBC_01618]|uniref:hypothetical protein n=1 Tax=Streptomyces sp. NBC_01618 TaxID=2975900 RepID=UPI0038703D93|nr:hypothetical protein OH735_23640 [Streptomyces sp. NBC_01618]
MSDRTPHDADGHDSDELLAELEKEITSWLEQGGMNLMTILNNQSVSDEATAKDAIRDLVQQDGFGGPETAVSTSGLLGRRDIGSGTQWSNLLAAYIDSLSCSLLPHPGDGDATVSFGLDEGHAGGCG